MEGRKITNIQGGDWQGARSPRRTKLRKLATGIQWALGRNGLPGDLEVLRHCCCCCCYCCFRLCLCLGRCCCSRSYLRQNPLRASFVIASENLHTHKSRCDSGWQQANNDTDRRTASVRPIVFVVEILSPPPLSGRCRCRRRHCCRERTFVGPAAISAQEEQKIHSME